MAVIEDIKVAFNLFGLSKRTISRTVRPCAVVLFKRVELAARVKFVDPPTTENPTPEFAAVNCSLPRQPPEGIFL